LAQAVQILVFPADPAAGRLHQLALFAIGVLSPNGAAAPSAAKTPRCNFTRTALD